MTGPADLLLVHAGELATLEGGVRRGEAMADAAVVPDGAVAIRDGLVVAAGSTDEVLAEWRGVLEPVVDAGGRAVVPGFVDAHTHPVFAGDRSPEVAWKLQGLSYGDIAARGGGILRTVQATRAAAKGELLATLLQRLDVMLAHGATTVEAKSGYGLDVETEVRLLEVVQEAGTRHAVDLVPTLMAAHAVPPEFEDAAAYAEHVATVITPAAAPLAELVDVFCEDGWFDVDASRRVLEAGMAAGLRPRLHADELGPSGGARLAADIGALSADHLLQASPEDVAAMVAAGVVPVLLPATAFTLHAPYADARGMVEAGASVAVATDFNPNCWCPSMAFAVSLACHGMRLTPQEALAAATVNAATALGHEERVGSLEAGKRGDLLVLEGPTVAHLAYELGTNPVRTVVKGGTVVAGKR